MDRTNPKPHIVVWESTRACNLNCLHCRATAADHVDPDQLTTAEVKALVDDVVGFAPRAIFIISGGEPLLRPDLFDILAYTQERGLRTVVSPNGTLLTPDVVRKLKALGVPRISVSLDGSSAATNDRFRATPGAYDEAVRGLRYCREGGLEFQINTTITRRNLDDLPAMLQTVVDLGAAAWHVFMLVPTGRAEDMDPTDRISPEEYEATLEWLFTASQTAPIQMRATCAPHFMRIVREKKRAGEVVPDNLRAPQLAAQRRGSGTSMARPGARHPGGDGHGRMDAMTRGCLAGNGFCFVSHVGQVFPCGYFPVAAGTIRQQPFREIYQHSTLFTELRDYRLLKGKCGVCEYKAVCGGCRARAYAETGDYLEAEPNCIYHPRRVRETSSQ